MFNCFLATDPRRTTTVYLHVSRLNLSQVISPLDQANNRFRLSRMRTSGGFEVADIFRQQGTAIDHPIGLPRNHLRVMHAIELCRPLSRAVIRISAITAAIWRYLITPAGTALSPNARPGQGKVDRGSRWDLLPLNIFMCLHHNPRNLISWYRWTQKVMYDLLFRSVSETVIELANDPKHLGAKIGVISILHTWGQNIMDHPHIHVSSLGAGFLLMETAGCLAGKGFFLPVKGLSALFRGKFLDHLKHCFKSGDLAFPGSISHLKDQAPSDTFRKQFYEKEVGRLLQTAFGGPKVPDSLRWLILPGNARSPLLKQCLSGQGTYLWITPTRPYGKEETLPARHPAVSIRRKTAPSDDTVDMGMIHDVLPPGVQNTNDAYFAPRCFGSLASSMTVSETERKRRSYMTFWFIDTRRLSSEGMVKTTWKYSIGRRSSPRASIHFSLARVWHLDNAGSGRSIRYLPDGRSDALILMTAQDRGSAELDGVHDPQMIAGQPMGWSISSTLLTKNVRYFKTSDVRIRLTKSVVLLDREGMTWDRFNRLTCR